LLIEIRTVRGREGKTSAAFLVIRAVSFPPGFG
jgi:hypothetical protein